MKYLCLVHPDEKQWEAMPETARDALRDECAAYERRLRGEGYLVGGVLEARDQSHALELMAQHPAAKAGRLEIRPAEGEAGRRLSTGKTLGWAVLGLLIVLPIAAALVGVKVLQFRAMGAASAQFTVPPERVNAAAVRQAQWQPRLASVGSVVAVQGTDVSAEAEGIVREILFEAGSLVQAGDELVRLDIDIEQAQLHEAEAAAELARLSYRRIKGLIASRTASQAELDAAAAGLKQAEARVDNIRAVIAKKTVRAPFAGRLGIRRISVGQFIGKGSPVVSLQSLDPVYVEFSLPQQRLGEVAEGLKVAVTADAYPQRRFEGAITAVNPDVDPATRNVRIQATLANADGRLRPGMFVAVEVLLERSETVLLIPATAVQHAPFGDSVFVIEAGEEGPDGGESLLVRQRLVRLGARQGDYVVALEGVRAGERIVSTGVFKLRPGMAVVIDNRLAPDFALTPKPDNT
ncbi:MAG: efflux RND transporter periplasmic adaptor subunit [Pseudomonadota bacterium]|nr:efflux RND transporter periplasmic adaptor subunit [Pseudomonadota bacterium]